ncbi:MAG: hypothetical protein MUD16_17640 [Desulfobacterales bacterium]|nr:hypothetical protein [Desulfobacterales bacterium]
MPTIMPEGEGIRKAVKWVDECRQSEPGKKVVSLIHEACVKFDLSPLEGEFLHKFFKKQE